MSYLNIQDNINTKPDIIGQLNKIDIIQEINERDILKEFSNKRNSAIFNGSTQNYYTFLGYTVLDLLKNGFRKKDYLNASFSITQLINGNFNRDNFIEAGYTIQDLVNAGFKIKLRLLGYTILDLYNTGFQKVDFDYAGFTVYDLLDVLPGEQVLELGYSPEIINAYRSFIFQIATTSWDSSLNQPHRYPINNILHSFQDLSINQIDSSGITTVIIKWSNDIIETEYSEATFNDGKSSDNGYYDQSNNGFFDSHTNDGLSLNPYTIPYYNDPTFTILQFGGITFTRNSAINSNFFQGYHFGGKIKAFDSPRFLFKTSFYNAFSESQSRIFQNVSLWNTYQITDMRGAFQNASNFHERIGQWNFSQIQSRYMENIISGTGYNPIQVSIFLQDLSNNPTLNNDISLGQIPPYFINSKTVFAVNSLSKKKIIFKSTGINPDTSIFLQSGYSISDAKIAGFTAVDLSNISNNSNTVIANLYNAGYSLSEINTIGKYGIKDYIYLGIPLSSFIQSNYTAKQLKTYINKPGYQAVNYYTINYTQSDISGCFSLLQLLTVGYSLTQLHTIGYSIRQIYSIVSITPPFSSQLYSKYNILNFYSAGFSLTDISNLSQQYSALSLSNLSNYSISLLKQSNIFATSLKSIGYSITQIVGLHYTLSDLHDASFTILQIQNLGQVYRDLSYAYAGFTLTDISNAGFSISNFSTYTPLPTILLQNNITAASWKNIGYTIQQIENLKYGINDLLNANFTLSQIIQSNYYQLIDYSNAAVSVSSLKSNGLSALSLKNIYPLSQLETVYDVSSLRVAGYSINDLNNSNYGYTILNYYQGGFQLQELVNYGYSFLELYTSLNPIYNLQTGTSIIIPLIPLYPSTTLINYGFTASDLYINYGIPLNILQQANYTTTEISTLNAYIQYNSYKNGISINDFMTSRNIQPVTVNSLYNAGFTTSQLAARINSTKTDISNILDTVNQYYTNPYDISGTFDNYFNTVILNDDAIQPYSYTELVSRYPPFQYNYSTMLPFGNTSLLGQGSDPIFSNLNTYNSLQYTQFTFLYPNESIPGSIYILDSSFGYIDISNGNFQLYNQINIYNTGWLTLCNFDYTNILNPDLAIRPLLGLRFFPFPIVSSTIKYSFWQTSANRVLEIIFNGTDSRGQPFQITIHIHDYGLITLCNGNGDTIQYNPGTLRYSNPDPLLTNMTPIIKYYIPPLSYTYDVSTNSILSYMYDIFRIDLRNSVQDPSSGVYNIKGITQVGYLAGQLNRIYSPRELRQSYPASSLKNIGYTAKQLYDLSYSPFDIVTTYNINIDISGILNYH